MRKGFTLIELLIVIGILAILATTVVLVLNPAQILAETRDTQRLNDLSALSSAIGLYLATSSESPRVVDAVAETAGRCTVDPALDNNPFGDHTDATASCIPDPDRTIDTTGWIDVKLSTISGGSPLAVLPVDPTNNNLYLYGYEGDETNDTYELNARLESTTHRAKMQNDGGNSNTCTVDFIDATCWYEIGTDPGLNL